MKMHLRRSLLMFAAILTLSTFALAQHGRPSGAGAGMGGGPSGMGAGAGSMGGPSGAGGGFGRPTDVGGGSVGHSNMGSQAPSTVLSNPHLNTSLTNALGKSGISVPGGNLQSACSGFKNLGQCVAAMHVAKNLNLNFSDLQNQMTGPNATSLGNAIKGLGGPNVNAKSQAKKANKQAHQDLNAAAAASMGSAS